MDTYHHARRFCDACKRRRNTERSVRAYVPSRHDLTCQRCGKPWTNRRLAKYDPDCRKEVQKEQRRAHARANRREARTRYLRAWGLQRRYGLTMEAYEALLAKFNHACAVCESTEDLCVDHCHDTGKVRGILCRRCNRSLGQLGDTTEHVRRLLDYLTAPG